MYQTDSSIGCPPLLFMMIRTHTYNVSIYSLLITIFAGVVCLQFKSAVAENIALATPQTNASREYNREQICLDAISNISFTAIDERIGNFDKHRGNLFLLSVNVALIVAPLTLIELQPGEKFQFHILNCGNCTDYDLCHVSFYSRLVGPSLRS